MREINEFKAPVNTSDVHVFWSDYGCSSFLLFPACRWSHRVLHFGALLRGGKSLHIVCSRQAFTDKVSSVV